MKEIRDGIEVAKLLKEVLMQLKHSMAKSFENLGVTVPQGMVMRTLSHSGKMKISELSNKLGLSNSTVSGIIDRLEKMEMVERARSGVDRRVVYVSITEKYEKVHQEIHKRVEDNIENIMRKGTPDDIDKIVGGLNALKKLLKD